MDEPAWTFVVKQLVWMFVLSMGILSAVALVMQS